jgi:hypothetical protein
MKQNGVLLTNDGPFKSKTPVAEEELVNED